MPWKNKEDKRRYEREYIADQKVKKRRTAKYAEWAERNKQHLLDREAKRRLHKRGQCLVATARTRSRRRGLAFDLDNHVDEIQALIDKGVCELTGYEFDLSPGKPFNSPSIDRIDPAKGYTYENIRIVLNLVNAALGDWGEDVLREVMKQWLK